MSFVIPGEPGANRPRGQKATDEELISAYDKEKSVWKVAKQFGMCGQSVHERLAKVGVIEHINLWTSDNDEFLKRYYLEYRDVGKLESLAGHMGRTKHFICRQAKRLGLTNMSHPRPYISTWKYKPREVAEAIWEKFKNSRGTLTQFCAKNKYDQLGFSKCMKNHFADEWDYVIELKAPKQTMYRYGRAFEYRCRDDLKKRGYFVLRSPRSGSPVDLIAIKTGEVVFVQCKRSGALPVGEWNELYALAASVSAVPIMSETPTGKGIVYWRMTGKKDGSKRAQPKVVHKFYSGIPRTEIEVEEL